MRKCPIFKLSADQLAALAGILEIDSRAAIVKLKQSLEWLGAYCPVWLQHDEKGPSRAEQNAGLKKRDALSKARSLATALEDASPRNRRAFIANIVARIIVAGGLKNYARPSRIGRSLYRVLARRRGILRDRSRDHSQNHSQRHIAPRVFYLARNPRDINPAVVGPKDRDQPNPERGDQLPGTQSQA